MRRIWLLGIAVALLTTACRIETNVLIDLNADGSGTFGFEFGLDDEFRELVSSQGEGFDAGEIFGALGTDLPGATVTERTEGDMMFTVAKFSFANQAELRSVINEGGGEGGDINVTFTDDTVTIEATLEGSGEEGGLSGLGGLGGLGDAAGDLGGDFGELGSGLEGLAGDIFSGSVIVGMPGEIGDNNADRVLPDGRLQWDLALDGGDLEIRAVSDLGGGSGFSALGVLVLVLIALAAIAWLISLNRRRNAAVAAIDAVGATDAELAPTGWDMPSAEAPPPAAESEEPRAPTDEP